MFKDVEIPVLIGSIRHMDHLYYHKNHSYNEQFPS